MLLHSVREIEGVVELKTLEHIQSTTQHDLPAVVGRNVAVMLSAGGVVFPGEPNADAKAGVRHFFGSSQFGVHR